MIELLVVAIGFSCLTPGVAIAAFGQTGLQPIMPLLALYCIVFPLSRLRLPLPTMQWAIANVAGFLISYSAALLFGRGEHEAIYLLFQSLLYLGAAVGFGAILFTPAHRRIFIESYALAALISSAIGIVQAILSSTLGIFLHLTNNENFSLTQPIGRAVAFTSEASDLAALMLPAFVCIYLEHGKPNSVLRPLLKSRHAQALLLAGLIATRSSMLLLLPILLLLTEAYCARNRKELVKSSSRTLVALTVAGVLFVPFYQSRLQDSDANWSAAWRGLKIEAGLEIFADHPLLGTGPGYTSLEADFSGHLDIPQNMTWIVSQMGAKKKGIDSTPVRLLAEGGVLGLTLAYYPVLVFWRRARVAAQTDEWRPFLSLSWPLLFAQAVAIGYRDLATMLLPSIVFTIASAASRPAGRGQGYTEFGAPVPMRSPAIDLADEL